MASGWCRLLATRTHNVLYLANNVNNPSFDRNMFLLNVERLTKRKRTIDLSGLTSLGCGHLTSETCFFNLKHTHFGTHTTQFVYFAHTFKKVAVRLFFSTVQSVK